MNTKIGKSFGLALLMAIGVVVTMLAMGMFSASGVSADHESGHTLPGQVSEVTFTPGSLNVNAKTNWDVSFGVSSALVAGSGTITIAFPAGVVLPATIDKTRISVGPGTDLVPLTSDPTVTSTTVTLTMPATDPGGAAASGAAVSDIITVSFSQLANLENPAKSGAAGSVSLGTAGKVQTSAQATYANIDVAKSFATTISNSVTSAAEGDTVVVTVGGFTPGLTVSLSGGFVSGSAVVGSDRKATINGTMKGATGTVTATDTAGITAGPSASITIKPTLTATASGKAQDTITLTGKNFTASSNVAGFSSILFGGTALASSENAVTTALKTTSVAHVDKDADGILDDFSLKIKIPSGATKGVNQVKVTDAGDASATANVDVEGRVVTISPTEGPPGTVIVVGGSGFPASIATSANNTISISPVFGSSSVTGLLTGGAGDLPGADQFTIPASATATTITVTVSIRGDDGANTTGTAKFTVQTRGLTVTPTSGPRGTKILVSGEKFTANGSVAANGILVDSVATVHALVNLTTTGGLPATEVTVPASAGLGAKTVSMTDSGTPALAGSGSFTVTQPTITLSPSSATMGQVVTITGAGWVPLSSVTITLNSSGLAVGTKVATAGSAGAFETTMELPSTVGVGLKVISFSAADGSSLGNTATAQSLTVPAPKVVLSAASATVGSIVTLDATGFVPDSGLSALTIGGADVREGVATTNSAGALTVSFKVPGLTGSQLVSVTIGGTTVSTSVTVTKTTAPAPSDTTPTADVFADLIANDNLIRVFRFDNSTQTWAFFDPRPAFAEASDLKATGSGDVVWVKLNTAQEFQGKTYLAGWSLFSLK